MGSSTLVALPIDIDSPAFAALLQWPFEDEFVARILAGDIPQRTKYQYGRIWAYLDAGRNIAAFGTLDICNEYAVLTGGKPHLYIPLLAVHPDERGRGYGRFVLQHLLSEAACIVEANATLLDPAIFLDVYEDSVAAIGLYLDSGFVALGDRIIDPMNGKAYHIMARRISH